MSWRNLIAALLVPGTSVGQMPDDLGLWIPYTNSVLAVEGYVLKQRAINEGGPEVDKLCAFLQKTRWSDQWVD